MEKKQYLTDGEIVFLPVSEEYLTDESGGMGWAEQICFPTTAGEACLALERARQAGLPVTVQGSRTGICGGALPQGGLVLNLSRMSGLSGEAHPERKELLLTVQAGVTLSELRQFLDGFRKDGLSYWFPPNPTEEQATLGGIMACRAEGGRAAFWGPAETWLVQVEAADFAGKLCRFQGGELERILGDEGHNWVILSLELRLPERPAHTGVLLCPFGELSGVSRFLERKDERTGLCLSMAEWLGVEALDLLSENAEALAKAGMSGLQRADTLLLEFTAPGEEEALNGLEELLGLLEECGCDVDGVLMGDSPKERERLLTLRHLLNETAAGKAAWPPERWGGLRCCWIWPSPRGSSPLWPSGAVRRPGRGRPGATGPRAMCMYTCFMRTRTSMPGSGRPPPPCWRWGGGWEACPTGSLAGASAGRRTGARWRRPVRERGSAYGHRGMCKNGAGLRHGARQGVAGRGGRPSGHLLHPGLLRLL